MSKTTGSTLILSLIILTAVLSTATTFAVIALSNFKQSKSIDDAVVSYYLAEVGVERGAYYFRRHNTDPLSCGVSNCNLDIEGEDKGNIGFLSKDDSVQLDVYAPGGSGYTIRTIVPAWERTDPVFTPNLEISLVGWNGMQFSDPYKKIHFYAESGNPVDIYSNCKINGSPINCNFYRIRFRALSTDMKNLQIIAKDQTGAQQNFPGVFQVKATGSFGKSQQASAIITSHLPPLSGLYDYVLFSEEELIKTYCGDKAVQGSEECDDGSQCSASGLDCTAIGDAACYYPDPDPENPGGFITIGDGKCLPRSGDGCSAACEVE